MTNQESANLTFMALVIWRESRNQTYEGMTAVGHSIMNRVIRPTWWGNDIQSVVGKKWQYSSMTDPKDKQLTTWPKSNDKSWTDALSIAVGVIGGILKNPVPGADSYYDISIPAPDWTKSANFIGQIGKLRFYDVDKDFEK